jgi:CBS domain-containing protein
MDATTVGKLLQTKTSSKIWTVGPNALVYEALESMARHDVGALIVLDEGRVVGVFSERDYARKVILKGKSSRIARVKEMMATNVLYATSDMSVDDCMHLMTEKRVRHLPVMEADTLIGIITIGDVVKRIIASQHHEIRQLEKYIRGTGL